MTIDRDGAVDDDVEDQQHHPGDEQADGDEARPPTSRWAVDDEALLDVLAGQPAVHRDRRDTRAVVSAASSTSAR